MKIRLLLAACLLAQLSFAQTKEEDPEYTEEMALYKAKEYAAFELIDRSSDSITRFILHPLEAGKSAEMTTLYFKCESQGKEGLLLGFNGEQKNSDGRSSEASDFYYLPKAEAIDFLNRIISLFEREDNFFSDEKDQNNGLFQFGELKVVIYEGGDKSIRIFWNGFDSNWELDECEDTLKELMKAME